MIKNGTSQIKLVYLMTIILSCCLSHFSYGQQSIHLDFSRYLTFREGHTYGIGLESQKSENEWIIGINYVDLGNRRFGREVAVDSGTTSNGIGFKFEYNRFLAKDGRGLFVGFRHDIEFVKNRSINFLSSTLPITESKSTVIQPTFQLGFQQDLIDKFDFTAYLAIGANINSTFDNSSVILLGFKLARALNQPSN